MEATNGSPVRLRQARLSSRYSRLSHMKRTTKRRTQDANKQKAKLCVDEEVKRLLNSASIRKALTALMEQEGGDASLLADVDADVDAGADASALAEKASAASQTEKSAALAWAAASGRPDAVGVLVRAGGDARFQLPAALTPLHYAAASGCSGACRALVDAGADVDARCRQLTALDAAAISGHAGLLPLLLDAGASPSSRRDAVAWAAKAGWAPCVRVLLRHADATRADADWKGDEGRGALHVAADEGHVECVRELLDAGADADLRTTPAQDTALHLACENGFSECAALLVARGASTAAANARGQTPLHRAADACSAECVEALLGAAPDAARLDVRDADGRTPLHYQYSALASESTRVLVGAGADVNARDRFGLTPLHLAARNGLPLSVQLLLAGGADVCVRSERGVSALSVLARKMPWCLRALYRRLDAAVSVDDACATVYGSGVSKMGAEWSAEDVSMHLNFQQLLQHHDAPGEIGYVKAFVDEGQDEILQHPLCQAFLHFKWQKIRNFYLVKIIFYVVFVLALSCNAVLLSRARFCTECKLNATFPKSDNATYNDCKDIKCPYEANYYESAAIKWALWVVLTLSFLELLRKIFGLAYVSSVVQYLSHLHNILEWFVVLCALVSSPLQGVTYPCWTDHVHVFMLLAAYSNLTFMVGQLPLLESYVIMYMSVLRQFVKVFAAYLCLLIGFAVIFRITFPGIVEFWDPLLGFTRVLGMMSGEILFQNTFVDHRTFLKETASILFIIFVLFVTIVLMNLLVGLAVSDIQALHKSADLLRMKQQTKLIDRVEKALLQNWFPSRIRKYLCSQICLSPRRYRVVFEVKPLSPGEKRLPKPLLDDVYHIALTSNSEFPDDSLNAQNCGDRWDELLNDITQLKSSLENIVDSAKRNSSFD